MFVARHARVLGRVQLREEKHNIKNYTPAGSISPLLPGTYYLSKVDEMNRRFYSVKA